MYLHLSIVGISQNSDVTFMRLIVIDWHDVERGGNKIYTVIIV